MALSLYQRYMTRRNPPPPPLSPAASAASFRDVADSVVFGPPGALRGGPAVGPAVVTHTCLDCWCQQPAGTGPCWQCGGTPVFWDPPLPPPEPVQVATVTVYGNDD